jgi:hypothetical protein
MKYPLEAIPAKAQTHISRDMQLCFRRLACCWQRICMSVFLSAPQREGFAIAFATLVCSGMANGDVFMSPVVTRKCIEAVVVRRHFD